MNDNFIFSTSTMAEAAESEIKNGLEQGVIGYSSKVTAFEMAINGALPFIKSVSLFHFFIDFKDNSVLTLKDAHNQEHSFYTQTQPSRG